MGVTAILVHEASRKCIDCGSVRFYVSRVVLGIEGEVIMLFLISFVYIVLFVFLTDNHLYPLVFLLTLVAALGLFALRKGE